MQILLFDKLFNMLSADLALMILDTQNIEFNVIRY